MTSIARSLVAVSLGAGALVMAEPAQATYSTVAMERATGRYGMVSASCVRLSTLQHVYAVVPGHGAVLTQSDLVPGDASQALALDLLGQSAQATDVIAAMTDTQFDSESSLRQYVVLDYYGGLAAFTGGDAGPFAGHLDASDTAFSVGIAGNILTGASVLEAAALGFRDEAACDFEARLVNALVASSAEGLGDARCVPEGRPAQSSWLHVAGSNGDLDISVDAPPGVDPIADVLSRFSEWRSTHPCPVEPEPSNPPPTSAPPDSSSQGCAMAPAPGNAVPGWLWLLVLLWVRRGRDGDGKMECAGRVPGVGGDLHFGMSSATADGRAAANP